MTVVAADAHLCVHSLVGVLARAVLHVWHDAGPIVSPIDVAAATDNRDSLAKTIYSRLFDWLVEKINTSIGQDPHAATMVGVLDIYGGFMSMPY